MMKNIWQLYNKIIFKRYTISNQSIIHDISHMITEFKNLLLDCIPTLYKYDIEIGFDIPSN